MMATAEKSQGAAMLARPDFKRYSRRMIAGAVALFLVFISALSYLFGSGTDIAQRYAPLVDAAMEIKLEATTAHLWLEEILSGDRQEDINDVWRGLDRADWYAKAMLEGGKNAEGRYLGLTDPDMRAAIELVRARLAEFRELAKARHTATHGVSPGTDIDQRFDAIFVEFITGADHVESLLQQEIASSLRSFRDIFVVLALGILLLFIAATTLIYRAERRRDTTYENLLDAKQTISSKTAEAEYLAHFDSLTGLPNRVLCCDRIYQAIDHARHDKQHLAVMCIDLDNFKTINDSMGHQAGDQILQSFAHRVKALIRNEDTLSRLGGDEFSLIVTNVRHHDMAVQAAGRLASKIRKIGEDPVMVNGEALHFTASMGVVIYPRDGEDPGTLMRNAEIAMYQAKRDGRDSYRFYSKDLDKESHKRLKTESDLRAALKNDEFVLHYQPYFNLEDQSLAGAEVLVRWNHPERGLVMPGEFIEIAEETGLIVNMGEWIMRTACQQFLDWRDRGLEPGLLSVNLSGVQFNDPGLVDTLKDILDSCALPSENIQLEITETAVMTNSEQSMSHLNALNDMGFQLAIDDFGTGYSSMASLKHFPVDQMKLDMTFVRDIGSNRTSDAIIRGMIDLARNLELGTIAEGIETEAQRDFLRQNGCTKGQGYLFAKPMPARELEGKLLAARAPNTIPFRPSA